MVMYQRLTSEELMQFCRNNPKAGEMELVLVDRLANALDEIDALISEIQKLYDSGRQS